jgi:hypothetical protein
MLENKLGEDYADALKEALVLRRAGDIDPAIDTLLGHILYSISQWSIAEAVRNGQLWRTFSQDVDFQSEVLLAVVNYSNKVDLSRRPKEVLIYLKKCGRSAIRDQIMKANALKRQHESIELDGAVIQTDFYGHRNGVAYEIESDDTRRNNL